MRAVVCRVERAAVVVEGREVGRIGRGLLVFVGVVVGDDAGKAAKLAEKLVALRLFGDESGKMNLSVCDVAAGAAGDGGVGGGGDADVGLLLIPNFTLAGRTGKGTRPSFSDAAGPEVAGPLFDAVVAGCRERVRTETGVFRSRMEIDSWFDGPVTVVVEI